MGPCRLPFSTLVDRLAQLYGEPAPPAVTEPFAMILWENVAYLASDAKRAEAFAELQAKVGLAPKNIRKASDSVLLAIAGKGIVPANTVEKLRRAAEIARDEFGDTNMLVIKPEEGASLARALGSHPMVLMRRHGVTIIGSNVRDCVYRAIQSCRNADFQARAMNIGAVASLSEGETRLAGNITGTTTALTRSWDYWARQISKADRTPKAASPARDKSKSKYKSKPARKAHRR